MRGKGDVLWLQRYNMNYIGFKGRECHFFFLRNIKANIKVIIFFFYGIKIWIHVKSTFRGKNGLCWLKRWRSLYLHDRNYGWNLSETVSSAFWTLSTWISMLSFCMLKVSRSILAIIKRLRYFYHAVLNLVSLEVYRIVNKTKTNKQKVIFSLSIS